jgi:hypothetical protein
VSAFSLNWSGLNLEIITGEEDQSRKLQRNPGKWLFFDFAIAMCLNALLWKALECHCVLRANDWVRLIDAAERLLIMLRKQTADVTRVEELAINEASLANLAACGYDLGTTGVLKYFHV